MEDESGENIVEGEMHHGRYLKLFDRIKQEIQVIRFFRQFCLQFFDKFPWRTAFLPLIERLSGQANPGLTAWVAWSPLPELLIKARPALAFGRHFC